MTKRRINVWTHPIDWVGFKHKDRRRFWPFKYREETKALGRKLSVEEQNSIMFFKKIIEKFPDSRRHILIKMFNKMLIEKKQHKENILYITGDEKIDETIHFCGQKTRNISSKIWKTQELHTTAKKLLIKLESQKDSFSGDMLKRYEMEHSQCRTNMDVLNQEIQELERELQIEKEKAIVELNEFIEAERQKNNA